MTEPRPPRRPTSSTHHGEIREDPYAWLRDRDAEVLAHLGAENEYAEATIDGRTPGLRASLYAELRGRIKEDDESVPVRDGPWWYFHREREGLEYPIHCRRPVVDSDPEEGDGSPTGPVHVYLDENALAGDAEYFALDALAISPDHRWMAYAVDREGDEIYTIRIVDLDSGETLPDVIEGAGTSLVWAMDSRTLLYDRLDDAHRPFEIYRHARGTPAEKDTLVFQEPDEAFFVGAYRTRDDRWLVISIGSQVTSEMRIIPADAPDRSPRVFAARRKSVEYSIASAGDRVYVLTNEDAKNFRLLEAPRESTERDQWREVIAHDPTVYIEDVDAFEDYLVIWERFDGLRRIRVLDRHTLHDPGRDPVDPYVVEFPDAAYTVWGGANPHYATTALRFGYASPTRPSSVFSVDLRTHERRLLKQREVVGGHDPQQYRCDRFTATAPDGTAVPVTLVHHVDHDPRNGPQPMVLYGYGAYGSTMEARFSASRLSLLDRGVAWATAHIRGGGDMGRHWYEDGKLAHKQNTFSDFIACADALVERNYTRPACLVGWGGSAGGLLIGAVADQRPDAFGALIADVPFVDVLNTLLDPTLPLTVVEWEEWGDPRDAEQYAWIRAYSPYDNVSAQAYPHLLALAGLSDPRVGYWEPAKWCARLRDLRTDSGDTLLWTQMEGGHAGASGRFAYLHEIAMQYAFVLHHLQRLV